MLDPLGLIAVAVLVLAAILAAWVFTSAPDRQVNRRLALVLWIEALTIGTAGGLTYLSDQPSVAGAWRIAATVTTAFAVPAYLGFLATLGTPLVRPWRSRTVLATVWVVAALALVVGHAVPGLFWIEFERWGTSSWNAAWLGPYGAYAFLSTVVVHLYGLVVAIDAWLRAAPGSSARDRARLYTVAFGIRDLVAAYVLGSWAASVLGVSSTGLPLASAETGILLTNTAPLLMVTILAYALLRHQLFDIDLKVKFAIEKSTVVAVFAGLIFVVSEALEQILGVEQFVPAIVAAGVIALALRPLLRLGQRVADRLMPGVRDDEEYLTVRKHEVYRAALESATEDGEITARERGVLATLASELGLDANAVHDLERGLGRPESPAVSG